MKKIIVFNISSPFKSVIDKKLIKSGISFLNKNGYSVEFDKTCQLDDGDYLAGNPDERAELFNKMLCDSSKIDDDIIFMSFWGGNNTNQILPLLKYSLFSDKTRIIGYSDTSSLLISLFTKSKIKSINGPAFITFIKPQFREYALNCLTNVFNNSKIEYIHSDMVNIDKYYVSSQKPMRFVKNKEISKYNFMKKSYSGMSIASHLDTFCSIYGTEYCPDMLSKILFLEESFEFDVEAIERKLTELKLRGLFDKIELLVLGRFMKDSRVTTERLELILKRLKVNIPVLFNINWGHIDPIFSLPNGWLAEINEKCEIQFTK